MVVDQIANELVVASLVKHTNNVSAIASELGYKPLLIVNALYDGDKLGKFKYNSDKDLITIGEEVEVEKLSVTESLSDLRGQIEKFIGHMNALEKDMTLDELQMFLPGTPELHIRMCVYMSQTLTSYELKDPKDKKSVYTFVTLKENADKQYGKKQFKSNGKG